MDKEYLIQQLEAGDWAVGEFGQSPLVDARLNNRLEVMATDFARKPGAPLPQACETDAKTAGAYRFIENDVVEPQQMLEGHVQATRQRLSEQQLILSPQDTVALRFNYPDNPDVGSIKVNGHKAKSLGIWAHWTHTYTEAGLPLGMVHQHFWARGREPEGQDSSRNQTPIEEKESVRWLESWQVCQSLLEQLPASVRWVNIADMEGDIYEVFTHALAQKGRRVEVLVRSKHNRAVEGSEDKLWEQLAKAPMAATLKVQVSRRKDRSARLATLQVRFTEARVAAPSHKAHLPPLVLWAVEAREINPPPGEEPILWRLLTTVPVTNPEEALQVVRWYAARWRIEVFHKILKSVCKVERHQFETGPRLERGIVIDMVVAWRIQMLTQLGREMPEVPASVCFTQTECRALYCYIHRTTQAPETLPTLGQMNQWLARLGGFRKCKANPHPGPIILARGLEALTYLTEMYEIQNASRSCVE